MAGVRTLCWPTNSSCCSSTLHSYPYVQLWSLQLSDKRGDTQLQPLRRLYLFLQILTALRCFNSVCDPGISLVLPLGHNEAHVSAWGYIGPCSETRPGNQHVPFHVLKYWSSKELLQRFWRSYVKSHTFILHPIPLLLELKNDKPRL